MKITERQHDGVVIIGVEGRPGTSGRPLIEAVEGVLARGERQLLLSLQMEGFDSGCLGEVVVCHLRASNKGAILRVAALDRRSWAVVGSSDIGSLMGCFSTEEAALQSFNEH